MGTTYKNHTAQQMKFSIRNFFSKCEQEADLVTFIY